MKTEINEFLPNKNLARIVRSRNEEKFRIKLMDSLLHSRLLSRRVKTGEERKARREMRCSFDIRFYVFFVRQL